MFVTMTTFGTTAIFTGKYTGATLKKVYMFHCTKTGCNLRIYHKMRIYLQDIKDHLGYLKHYWFNLKNCTGILFGIYRLYYRLLVKCVHNECPKSDYHNIVNGPRTIEFNCRLLGDLIHNIQKQIREIYYMVSTKYMLHIQDYSMMIGV